MEDPCRSWSGWLSNQNNYTVEKMRKVQLFIAPLFLLALGLTGCGKNAVKDIDGNKYKTIKIGTQIWMAENLKTTHFNDGTSIVQIDKYDDWKGLISPAYCWYANDSTNKEVYGALYNWYAVNTKKLCPKGWHVPTDEEWKQLEICLGMSQELANQE